MKNITKKELLKQIKKLEKENNLLKSWTIADHLEGSLGLSKLGDVEGDVMSDKSCRWLKLEKNHILLSFTFTPDGKTITNVGLYQDILEVTDQKQIFTFKS